MKKNILQTIAKLFKSKGQELTQDEILEIANDVLDNEDKPKPQNNENNNPNYSHNKEIIDTFKTENATLKEIIEKQTKEYQDKIDSLLKGFEEEKIEREKALNSLKEEKAKKEQEEKTKSIESLINTAIENKKLAPQDNEKIDKIKKLADTDIDLAKDMLDSFQSVENPSNSKAAGSNQAPKQNFSTKQDIQSYLSDLVIN